MTTSLAQQAQALQDIARRASALSDEKQQAFLRQLGAKGIALGKLPIVASPRSEDLPLSHAQQRLWFLWQLEPDSPAYNIASNLRLRGALAIDRVEQAFTAVVRRHEALRTRFPATDGQARQCIDPPAAVPVTLHDLTWLDDDQRLSRAQNLVEQEARRPFDLACGPLLRVGLIRLADDDHVLLLTLHHIVADGWSLNLLINEFAALYGGAADVPTLAVQYKDYALWQRNLLRAGEGQRQLDYWRQQLAGHDGVLELPLDHPRALHPTLEGASVPLSIAAGLAEGLRAVARAGQVSLFSVLLTAFNLLLWRHSGQRDLLVGVPIANRQRQEVQNLLGLFVNTQVMRCRLDPRQTFLSALAQVAETGVQAQSWQDLPFEQLVDALQGQRSLNRTPLFQVMFNHQQRHLGALERLPGLTAEPFVQVQRSARFDLALDTEEDDQGGLRALFTYPVALFDTATVQGMADRYLALLEQIAAQPEGRVGELGVAATPAWLDDFNRTERAFPDACLHHLFEAQAARTPQACAVVCGERHYTYAELDRRANQVAHQLRAWGVGPDALVAIAVPRSLELLVGLLGILKAGGAYVPLDPDYPAERLAYMLDDCRAGWLVSQHEVVQHLAPGKARVLCLDRDQASLAALPDSPPAAAQGTQTLAYCIYTSGSTGKPKGVAISHAAVVNFLSSMARAPGISASDRVLGLTSLSFDIAALELYLPLLNGARLVLVDRDCARDPQRLLAQVRHHDVSLIQATPSTWRMLLAGNGSAALAGRRLLCGGEALDSDLAARLLACGSSVWNLYGPTETTIWSAVQALDSDQAWLGRPLDNTQLYVLDDELNRQPPGVAGELYIGGRGLARGYLRRPGLTAERFVADPFGEPGGRLYRTGDRVRLRADGRLQYLERVDHQVKVRGFRIELGEIEARLREVAGVREAAVIARDGAQGKQLVAYLCARDEQVTPLRQHLQACLPEHMMPAYFVFLAHMPLTPNGKLDRLALPAPDMALREAAYVEPQGASQHSLAAIWQRLLSVDRVGGNDNFFELGGDSILSIQMVSQARDAGLALTPKQVFQHQTLAAMAAVARPVLADAGLDLDAPLVALQPAQWEALRSRHGDIEDIYPLSPMQQGMLFHALQAPGQGLYVNQLTLRIEGLDPARLASAWQQAIARHPALRTAFVSSDEVLAEPAQIVLAAVAVPFQVLDWSNRDVTPAALEALAQTERDKGFDLACPPLQRLLLVDVGQGTHQLIWTSHHILMDGWSSAQLVNEVLQRYQGHAPAQVAAPFRHYLAWLQRQDAAVSETFWRHYLGNLEAPTLLAAAVGQSLRGEGFAQHPCTLGHARSAGMQAFAKACGVTLNTLVQGAWLVLLQRYSAQHTVCVGTTVAGRPHELEGAQQMLGLFINTLPLICAVPPSAAVGDWLRGLQDSNLAVREHQHTPLYQLQSWAGQGGQALFDSLIVFENYPVDQALRERSTADLRLTQVHNRETSHYPLTLTVHAGSTLEIVFGYRREAFDEPRIQALQAQLLHVLDQMLEAPDAALGNLQLLDRRAQAQVLGFNPPARPLPLPCLSLGVQAQVARSPHAIAVACASETLSYAALNARANRLARELRRRGVAPGVLVGVALERSSALLVALLAVIKAGGAYVPLDPDYPAERLAYMLEDSGARLVISQSSLAPRLPVQGVEVLCLDRDEPALAVLDSHDLPPLAGPEALLYVIYTSGSTGQPKGAGVTRAGFANLLHWYGGQFDLGAADRFLVMTSPAFDLTQKNLYAPLLCGGQVHMAAAGYQPLALLEHIAGQGITALNCTPSMFYPLLDMGTAAQLGSLRHVFLGGEPIHGAQLRGHLAHLPTPPQVHNSYGPTECTDVVAWHTWQGTDGEVPTGIAVDNTRLYIVDSQFNLLPPGAVGELLIAGTGVGRGYHQRPSLSAERFMADPFAADGSRLYRSGDLARYTEAGVLEYVGRVDHQVKIRGVRIELGEIEARLGEHVLVDEAVVIAHQGGSGPQLVAYLVLADAKHGGDLPATLRQYLRQSLPDSMVPSHWQVLPALPLTPSGKLDRKGLPLPQVQARQYRAPHTELQRQLASIWASLLGVERIGLDDDFFELGGHSLLLTQALSRIQQTLHVRLSLAQLFDCATLADLASHIETSTAPRASGGDAAMIDDLLASLEQA
ncbi:amino acid adenylation domain-containing protein [Pseudomonas sp. TE3610]